MDKQNDKTLNDLQTQSASLRDSFAVEKDKNDIHLDALHITDQEQDAPSSKLDFSASSDKKPQEDKQLHYRRWFLRLVHVTWVALMLAAIVFFVYQYQYNLAFPSSHYMHAFMYDIHPRYKTILSYINLGSTYRNYQNLSLIREDALQQLDRLYNASLSFVDKKYIIDRALQELIEDYNRQRVNLAETQTDIAQYGFLPAELVNIFQASEVQVSLQRGLLALESIKFATAIQVFSYLDTFISEFANYIGMDKEYVREQLQYIAARGDQDIYAFLSHCYMNPYELSYDCSVIGDFDVRYANQPNTNIDTNFLKQLLYYIDQKLEQTEFPSLNITFQRFDPRAETITFSIQVNTFPQDEAALVQAGIVNPHIYIVTNIIHLLKQNRFIQGSAIDAKQINIQPKTITIGSNQFVVNNSILQYTLPLQKDVIREIYDFQN